MGGGGENGRSEASGRWLHMTVEAEASPHVCSSLLPEEQKFNILAFRSTLEEFLDLSDDPSGSSAVC